MATLSIGIKALASKFVDIKCEPNITEEVKRTKKSNEKVEKERKSSSKNEKSSNEASTSEATSVSKPKLIITGKPPEKPKTDVSFSKQKIANKKSEDSAKLLRPVKEKKSVRDPQMEMQSRHAGKLFYKYFYKNTHTSVEQY